MKLLRISTACLLTASMATGSAFALDANSVASVNGKKITNKEYQAHLKNRQLQNQKSRQQLPISRQIILDELINREILLQEAKRLKLHKDKKLVEQVNQYKNGLLIQALVAKSPAANPVSDKEMKKIYDEQIAKADPSEYKLSHIIVKDQANAKKLIEKLNDGADFAEVAKKESTDPSSKDGGSLPWVSIDRMPQQFAQAITKLKKGMHTQAPVQTQHGFHIIKMDDKRKRELAKFEDVKEQIRQLVQTKRFQEYALKLRSKAKIQIK